MLYSKPEKVFDFTVSAGTILTIERGAYSDRVSEEPVRVLKTFNTRAVAMEFAAQWKRDPDDWQDDPHHDAFLPWLHKNGYVEDICHVVTWDIGNYCLFDGR